jgi:myo-inositol-1-phosphate synthase
MKNRAPQGSLERGCNSARDCFAYLLSIAATRCFKRANCPSTSMQSCAFAFSLPLSDKLRIRCYYGEQIVLKQTNINISPASGRLGVLIPGMGAVTSTFIAGVEAVKQGLGEPIGSLTQLATIRLGKRTEGRTPKIKDSSSWRPSIAYRSARGTSSRTMPTKPPPAPGFWTPRCSNASANRSPLFTR